MKFTHVVNIKVVVLKKIDDNIQRRKINNTLPSLTLENHKIYNSLFKSNPNPVIILERNKKVHKVNEALWQLTGYNEIEFSIDKWIDNEYLERTNLYIDLALSGDKQVFHTVATAKFKKHISIRMTLIPIEVEMQIVGLFVVVEDITDMQLQQIELKRIEQNLTESQLVGNIGSWDYDVIEDEAYWSNQMYVIFGLEETYNFIPTYETFLNFIHNDDKNKFIETISAVLNFGTSFTIEFRIIRKDGTERILKQIANAILDENGKTVRLIGTCHDITELRNIERKLKETEQRFKKAEEKIKHIENHDYLTNLSNRVVFDKSLKLHFNDCKANSQKMAILYLDIDRFKNINDTLGHSVGDELIKQISNRLIDLLADTRLFRIGGDEFAIILKNIEDHQYPLKIAKNINEVLKGAFVINGYELHITTSIGISIYPLSGKDEESLLKGATAALARAKKLGKNNIQVHTNLPSDETYKSYYLETEMRKAIKNNQFEVFYQPRICTETETVLSAEALIRWNHHEWGIVSPNDFIPLAEESGFITEIDKFVITTVCKQLKEWQCNQLTVIPVSVNISAKSFFKNDLVSNILATFQEFNINTELLELEITETSFLHNMDKVSTVLSELKQQGIKVALDDFGTGYSSLTHLKALKIDTIKIDRSFIRNITNSKQDETICSCVIQLAHGLNINVVAEGVETREQFEWLHDNKCNEIQGYLFSKPVRATEFARFLKKKYLIEEKKDI